MNEPGYDTTHSVTNGEDAPIEAVLVGSPFTGGRETNSLAPKMTGKTIRNGSPFRPPANRPQPTDAAGTATSAVEELPLMPGFSQVRDGAAEFEAGVLTATARGGVLASWLVLPFAIVSAWLFPFGGLMIGVLGTLLGAFGLSSKKTIWAMAGLGLNGILAGFCYWQLI